jgi:hypothetical protein
MQLDKWKIKIKEVAVAVMIARSLVFCNTNCKKNMYTTAGMNPQFNVNVLWTDWFMGSLLTNVTIVLFWEWNMLQTKMPMYIP